MTVERNGAGSDADGSSVDKPNPAMPTSKRLGWATPAADVAAARTPNRAPNLPVDGPAVAADAPAPLDVPSSATAAKAQTGVGGMWARKREPEAQAPGQTTRTCQVVAEGRVCRPNIGA